MQTHQSAEDYLETILILQRRMGDVRSVDIAAELGFSKPSISVAMKKLRENGLITADKNGYIRLTGPGRAAAEHVYERHVLLSEWLTDMGVDPAVAAEDACRIEHVISEESFTAIRRQALHRKNEKNR